MPSSLCRRVVAEKKLLFIQTTLSQHVYSLAPGILRVRPLPSLASLPPPSPSSSYLPFFRCWQDASSLIAPSNLLRSHPKYFRPAVYGTSVCASIASGSSVASSSKKAIVPEVAKGKGKEKEVAAAATAPDKLKPKKVVSGTLDFSKNLSKDQKEPEKEKEKSKVSSSDYFLPSFRSLFLEMNFRFSHSLSSNSFSQTTLKRKSSPTGGSSSKSTTINVSKPAPPPPSPPPAAKSSLKAKPKSRVVLSEDEDEEEEVVVKPKKKQMDQAQIDAELKGLEGMWDDVDMEVDENGDEVVAGKGKEKATSTCEYHSFVGGARLS